MDPSAASFKISTHALREEGDLHDLHRAHSPEHISTHALREEGDIDFPPLKTPTPTISTHALREEGDYTNGLLNVDTAQFLPTPSARRATATVGQNLFPCTISTHALREEGDPLSWSTKSTKPHFYPRPPRGGRPTGATVTATSGLFLPTPSARRATSLTPLPTGNKTISTHALREEGDFGGGLILPLQVRFLPTPSARRATAPDHETWSVWEISTHALREEGDTNPSSSARIDRYFYPRPPRGGRPAGPWMSTSGRTIFLPTPSARRATGRHIQRCGHIRISTHALREEGDLARSSGRRSPRPISTHALREEGDERANRYKGAQLKFLPTPSARRATVVGSPIRVHSAISTHALREEGDSRPCRARRLRGEFLPTPSARRATLQTAFANRLRMYFYPRPPRGGRRWLRPPRV